MNDFQTADSSPGYEIRVELLRYLRGDVPLDKFAGRFTDLLWQISDPNEEAFAYQIELRLAELSNGHWSEAEFRKLMTPLARTHMIEVNPASPSLRTGTAAEAIHASVPITIGERFVGTTRDTALA